MAAELSSIDPRSVTLAVLAGGEGSRMGRPKGSLILSGRPILHWLAERLAWDGPTVLVTAPGREHPPGAELFGEEVVDPVAGEGPLRGIHTAIEQTSRITLVVTVDMPGLAREQLLWLLAQFGSAPLALGMMLRREGTRIEPFPSVYRAGAAAVLASKLATGQRSVHGLLDNNRFLTVDAPATWPARVWANLNRPDDVAAFETL